MRRNSDTELGQLLERKWYNSVGERTYVTAMFVVTYIKIKKN